MKIPRKHSGNDLTIFSEMSALAMKHQAVNLSQGFPDYDTDPALQKLLGEAAEKSYNQYAPLAGNPQLIENLVTFNARRRVPVPVHASEITIVPGATYGIYCALATVLQPGDEVIVLEPCYDSYVPSIEMNGGVPVFVQLNENFELNWNDLAAAITEKTRAIIVNSPHNPTGKVWEKESMEKLWNVVKDTEIMIISDDVYDLLIYDDGEFHCLFNHPGLRQRMFSIFSFGKMFHITGWKIGYVLAPEELSVAFRRVHQYLTFCVNSPAQYALAKYLEIFDENENRRRMQQRRDLFCELMKETPFEIAEPAHGSYFQVAGFRNIHPEMSDKEFAVWLTREKNVATIPVSAFYHDQKDTGSVRFCFAKKEETIRNAVARLREIERI